MEGGNRRKQEFSPGAASEPGAGTQTPLRLDAHSTFLLPTPTAQERDVASDAPEASATESPKQGLGDG